jgi:nickel-type superoxide dismutase maturation protease
VNPPRPRWGVLLLAAAGAVAGGLIPRRVAVEGRSMEPTLLSGDRLLVVRGSAPRVGDIVAVRDPRPGRRLLVKRVVSVRGDEVVVEGDNQRSSTDSWDFGPVDRRAILGRAVYRYGPPGRSGRLP